MKNAPAANPGALGDDKMGTGAAAAISRGKSRGAVAGILAIGFVIYAFILIHFMNVYPTGGDSSGYYNCARLLEHGRTRVPQRVIPGADLKKLAPDVFVPVGFRPVGHEELAPEYSTGLPLALLAFSKIAGWNLGPPLVLFVSGLLGVLLTFLLGREWGLTDFWAGVAALILALNATYLYHTLVMLSDVPALVCATAAVLFAQWSRSRNLWALAAGCAVAAGVLVRPTNILAIIPVAVCLGFSWRRWLLLALGGLPGAVFLYLFTSHAYGHSFESSYGSAVTSDQFSVKFMPYTLHQYAYWMPVLLTPLALFILGAPVDGSPRAAPRHHAARVDNRFFRVLCRLSRDPAPGLGDHAIRAPGLSGVAGGRAMGGAVASSNLVGRKVAIAPCAALPTQRPAHHPNRRVYRDSIVARL